MNAGWRCRERAHGRSKSHDLLCRFVRDDSAQDLVEYALITAFIGIAGYLVLQAIGVDIFNTYSSWLNPASGVPSRWDPPDPVGSGS